MHSTLSRLLSLFGVSSPLIILVSRLLSLFGVSSPLIILVSHLLSLFGVSFPLVIWCLVSSHYLVSRLLSLFGVSSPLIIWCLVSSHYCQVRIEAMHHLLQFPIGDLVAMDTWSQLKPVLSGTLMDSDPRLAVRRGTSPYSCYHRVTTPTGDESDSPLSPPLLPLPHLLTGGTPLTLPQSLRLLPRERGCGCYHGNGNRPCR